ncbi:hypothetical protein CHPG_00009 [Cellulophaga phage phi3:1]|nr:hypothetical protein CHPG_00009 [Cellulophaga phage phi3:1]
MQLVGFDVYVHENTFPYKLPSELANLQLKEVQHGGGTQHGAGTQHGGDSFDIIANSIDEVESYAIGEESLWATFFYRRKGIR